MTFAERLKQFLKDEGLTWGKATTRTDGRIKRSYWTPLTDGSQVPTERTMSILYETFGKDRPAEVLELYRLTVYSPPRELVERVDEQARADMAAIGGGGDAYTEMLREVAKLKGTTEEQAALDLVREFLERGVNK